MEEELNFRRNKMDSMISSYQNKINKNSCKSKILEFEDDEVVEELQGGTEEAIPDNLTISTLRVDQMASQGMTIRPITYEANPGKEGPLLTVKERKESGDVEDVDLPSSTYEANPVEEGTPLIREDRKESGDVEDVEKPKRKTKKPRGNGRKDTLPTEKEEVPLSADIDPNDFQVKEIEDIANFVFRPVLKSSITFKCQIKRDASGLDRNMYPVYVLYHENTNGKKLFLLAARTRKKTAMNSYIISVDPVSLYKTDSSYIGKIKSNLMCTKFTFVGSDGTELSTVHYDYNIMGLVGPRKIKVAIPKALKHISNPPVLHHFVNKTPVWSRDYKSYVLNFNGRVTFASIKNFQLVTQDDDEQIVLQFGKIGPDMYSLDFVYPFTPVQAFSVALTSFASKVLRE